MKPFSDNKVPQNTKPHKPFSQICGLKRRNEEDPEEKSTKLLKPRCWNLVKSSNLKVNDIKDGIFLTFIVSSWTRPDPQLES